jgi:N-carbamoyl-L-amino-acid hydrolase
MKAIPIHLQIDRERLLGDLNAISRIGFGERGGVTRLAFSVKDLRARQLLIHLMTRCGLKVQIDRVGNIFGRLSGGDPGAPAVMSGSHLDTVVQGGKFDGAVGVVAALEVARVLAESGAAIPRPFEVACFVGEESSRFGYATLGSSLVAGEVGADNLANAVDAQGTKLEGVLAGMGIYRDNLSSLKRDPSTLKAYLELHIEQGPVLEAKNKRIGLVTAIAAPVRFKVTFGGTAAHSGTTPMELRRDALVAAAELVSFVEETCRRSTEEIRVVGTVGALKVDPGVINTIPGKTELAVDIRGVSASARDDVAARVQDKAGEIARRRGMTVEIAPLVRERPVELDKDVLKLMQTLCDKKKIAYEIMPSGAGHDAMQMAKITRVGMIFIPSRNGISHSPLEWSDPEDIALGTQLLLETVVRLAYAEI